MMHYEESTMPPEIQKAVEDLEDSFRSRVVFAYLMGLALGIVLTLGIILVISLAGSVW